MNPTPPTFADGRLEAAGVRRLAPDTVQIFEGTFSMLHCQVKGDALYRAVFAVLMFPIRHPNRFISLRHTDQEDKEREIGIIEDLSVFPEAQQALVRKNLVKHYYEQVILRIHEIESEYGLLFFKVETRRGPESFVMPWRHEKTEDFGASGKVLFDALGNRYVIPDLSQLPASDQRLFTNFIYW